MTHLNIIFMFFFIGFDFVDHSIQIDRYGTDDSQFPWLPANTEFITILSKAFVRLFAVLTVEFFASQDISSSTKSAQNTKPNSFLHYFSFSLQKRLQKKMKFLCSHSSFYTVDMGGKQGGRITKQTVNKLPTNIEIYNN